MFSGAYHPPWSGLLTPVTCEHTDCALTATHARKGFRFCFDHWLVTLQWEQPQIRESVGR